LRQQAEGFEEAADGVAEFAGSTVEIATELGAIRQTLLDSQELLAEYETSIDEGNEILDDLETRLTDQVAFAGTALLLLGVALAIGQTVPIAFGYWALRVVRVAEPMP
jgi:hypothetical protein